MKVIGTLKGGTVLIEANRAQLLEVANLFGDLLSQLPVALPPQAAVLDPTALPPTPPTGPVEEERKRPAKRASRSDDGVAANRRKKCIVCGDSFVDDSVTNTRVFCGEKCKHEANLAKGRAWRLAHPTKNPRKRAAVPAPVVTKLSREERLALIRKADEKLTSTGLLEAAGQKAAGIAAEDAGK